MPKVRKSHKKELPKVPLHIKLLIIIRRFVLKPTIIAIAATYLLVSYLLSLEYHTKFASYINSSLDNFYQFSGLVVTHVYLEGQKHSSQQDIIQAINIDIGYPIARVNLQQIKDRLESTTWVKQATIERQYPSTLSIRIKEKNPVALWQNGQEIFLIDDEGKIIGDANLKKFSDLIILVGQDIPLYTNSLMRILNSSPDIAKMVSSATIVSGRRWDIKLHNGIKIKLPEQNPVALWQKLSSLHKDKQILDSDVAVIDVRVADKMYIKSNAGKEF